jgi:hypothetical protein
MATGIEAKILEGVKAKLDTLTWPALVTWERLRLTTTDISSFEIPLVQLYMSSTECRHQTQTLESTMTFFVEVLLRQSATAVANQRELLDKIEDVKDVMGVNPNMDIPGVFHIRMIRREIDVHTLEPFFYGRLQFECVFKESYTRNCP